MPDFIVAKYTLIEAHKRNLLYLYLGAVVASFALAAYASSLAVTQAQATLAAFFGFFVRLCAVALAAGYLILTEMRTLEPANIHVWLGLPIGRARYLLEKILAYTGLMLGFALVALIPLLLTGADAPASLVWSLTLFFELLIVVALAMLFAVMFKQPLSALSLFALVYLYGRGAAEFYRHASNLIAQPGSSLELFMAWGVKLTTYLVPRLENFAATEWLLHPHTYGPHWPSLLLQTGLYAALLTALSLERIRRMQF